MTQPNQHNLDTAAPTGPAYPAGPSAAPEWIGPYRVLSVLGEGGFGVVYLAEQKHPIERRLAIKVLKAGMSSASVLARFELERRALAMMNHQNVAHVFDAGQTAQGLPYFAMEVVQGRRITAYCDQKRMTVRERVALLATVCDAVQHAHTKGIIHRDLKPSNILVEEVDGRAVPKVIDFGVAKATARDQADADRSMFTEQGVLIGTPAYMPPEQAQSGVEDVDTRADVYSLGVVLYELLAGALPFDPATMRGSGHAEVMRFLFEEEAPSPARRLSELQRAKTSVEPPEPGVVARGAQRAGPTPPDHRLARTPVATAMAIAEARGTDVATLIKLLKGELGWIPLKAMRKAREERYRSAAELADDLRNYLASRPLIAGPETTAYRLRKFVRRNRAAVLAGSAVIAALVAGAGGTAVGLVRAREALRREETARSVAEGSLAREQSARAAAEMERDRADTVATFMRGVFRGVGPQVAAGRDTKLVRSLMDEAAARINAGELREAPEAETQLRLTVGGVYRTLADYEAAEKMVSGAKARGTADAAMLLEQGTLIWERGDPAKAEPVLRRAVEVAGNDKDQRVLAVTALAGVLDAQGKSAEAAPLYTEALELTQEEYQSDHPDVAAAMSNLARSRQNMGDLAGATELLRDAYDMYGRLGIGDHPDVAATANNLGICEQTAGHTEIAEQLFEESLAMRKRIYAPGHPDIAQGMSNLAYAKLQRGNQAEAESLFSEALRIRRAAYPGDHPAIAKTLTNLGSTYRAQGKFVEAEKAYREMIEMLRRLFPDGHPDTVVGLSNLASALIDQSRFAEAEPVLVEALSLQDRLRPEGDGDTIIVLRKFGIVLEQLDRGAEGAAKYERALGLARTLIGAENLEVVRCLHGLARCKLKAGELEAAQAAGAEALAMGEKLLPAGHAGIADLRKTMERIAAAREGAAREGAARDGAGETKK